METKMKKVKITSIILAIVLVTLIAFAGIYVKNQNRMENKVKDYALSKELEGKRIIDLKVKEAKDTATEQTTENTEKNQEEGTETAKDTTEETEEAKQERINNYQTVKKTVEKRLKELKAQDYNVALNEEDGKIRVELAEDKSTDTYAYYLTAENKVEITDKDAGTEIINDSMIKKAKYDYKSNMSGEYQVYLELELTKEGQAKLEQETANYAFLSNEIEEIENAQKETNTDKNSTDGTETTETDGSAESTEKNENAEQTNNEESKEETKKISKLTIAGTEYKIDKIEKNKITVKIGSKTANNTSINNNMSKSAELTMLINSGKYPVEYEIENNRYVYSEISEKQIITFAIIMLAILLVVLVALSIKYKGKGILSAISFIGFMAVFSLLIRYTNVLISIEGIGAIILTLLINLSINKSILEKVQKMNMLNEAFKTTFKDQIWKLIPIAIISITFCFSGWTSLSSFGLIMFWGIILIPLYNIIVTKTLLELKESN